MKLSENHHQQKNQILIVYKGWSSTIGSSGSRNTWVRDNWEGWSFIASACNFT